MKIYNTKLYENDQPFLFYASLLVHPPRPFPAFSFQTRNIEDGFSTTPAFFFSTASELNGGVLPTHAIYSRVRRRRAAR